MGKLSEMLKSILERLPARYILLESAPDLSDNTKAVFDEMLRREINQRYKLVWFCHGEKKKRSHYKNVVYVYERYLKSYYIRRAKCVICCNRFMYSTSPKSFNIYLGHGNPLKNTKGYYLPPPNYNYLLSSSNGTKQIMEQFFSFKNVVALGYPRNDELTQEPLDLSPFFKVQFDKIIVWYPTYRQHKNSRKASANSQNALPILWDEKKAIKLNEFAKKNRVLIVIKPHFAQDVSLIKRLDLDYVLFINESFFAGNNISSYRFVGSCDALITDFSSIYYDYTLCDKPIGLIWEDYEEYKKKPGFAVDMDYMMKGGVKIYDLEGLIGFIQDVANGKDNLKTERREIRDYTNYSTDGNNTNRVVDFIIREAKL